MSDQISLLDLPDDIIINDILPNLTLDQMRHICAINPRMNELCKNEMLWRRLYHRDFPKERQISSLSPRRNYRFLRDISEPKSWESMSKLHGRAIRLHPQVQANIPRTPMTERPWR